MNPVLIAVAIVILYSIFLAFRSLLYHWRRGQRLSVFIQVVLLLLMPLALYFVALIPNDSVFKLWVGIPVVLVGIYWALIGFFMDAKIKKETAYESFVEKTYPEEQEYTAETPLISKEAREVKPPKGKWRFKQVAIIIIALIIWSYGVFVGISNKQAEIIALCLCVFLLVFSISSLWRWRNY